MAGNYAQLLDIINNPTDHSLPAWDNNNKLIEGLTIKQYLLTIIQSLTAGYQYIGVATPSTSPGTPDQNVFYIGGAGTYDNFGSQKIVGDGCLGLFVYNGEWSFTNIPVAVSYFQLSAGMDPLRTVYNQFTHLLGIIDYCQFSVAPDADLQGYQFKIQYISYNSFLAGKFYFQLRGNNGGADILREYAIAKSSLRRGEIIEGKMTMPTINVEFHFRIRISNDFAAGSSFANSGNAIALNIGTNPQIETDVDGLKTNVSQILSRLDGAEKIVDEITSASGKNYYSANGNLVAGDKVIIDCGVVTGSVDMYLYRADNTYITITTSAQSNVRYVEDITETFQRIYIYVHSGSSWAGSIIILRQGQLEESYEDTINGIIQNIQDLEYIIPNRVVISSSNLYDYNNRRVDWIVGSKGVISEMTYDLGMWCLMNFVPVHGLSKIILGGDGVAGISIIFSYAFYDYNKNYIPNSYVYCYPNGADVINVPDGAYYFCATDANNTPKHQINAGETIQPFEEYYRYYYSGESIDGVTWLFKPNPNDPALIEKINEIVDNGPEYEVTPFLPSKIYSVCNDMSDSTDMFGKRNYTLKMYLDHLMVLNEPRKIRFRESQRDIFPIFPKFSTYPSVVFNEDGSNVKETQKNAKIDGITGGDSVLFNQVTTRTSHVSSGFPKILCIGDSVTEGYLANVNKPYDSAPNQYWAWIKAHFAMEQHQANDESLYRALMLGHKNVVSFGVKYYDGTIINALACAEGKGGASLNSYLTAQYHGDGSGNIESRLNPFYDPDKAGTIKFSVQYWLNRYRTMDDNGNRLYFDQQQGTTGPAGPDNVGYLADGSASGFYIGSAVTDTTAFDVCKPTHIIVQLGYNDAYNTAYQTNYESLLSIINTEFPDCFVGMSLPDCPGTYFPEHYAKFNRDAADQYPVSYFNDPAKSSHTKFHGMNQVLKTLENVSNKVYYIPNFFVSPTAESAPVRVSQDAAYLSTYAEKDQFLVQSFAAPYLHPNNMAHAVWGYENFAWIKYTLSL